MYYIEIQSNQIIGKGEANGIGIKLNEGQIEVSDDIFNQLTRLPADYETDGEGNIISVTPAPEPEPEPVPQPPTQEEILLTALLEIQELKQKVAELEGN